eukprot:gene16102-19097_t
MSISQGAMSTLPFRQRQRRNSRIILKQDMFKDHRQYAIDSSNIDGVLATSMVVGRGCSDVARLGLSEVETYYTVALDQPNDYALKLSISRCHFSLTLVIP